MKNSSIGIVVAIIGIAAFAFLIGNSLYKNTATTQEPALTAEQSAILAIRESDWVTPAGEDAVTLVEYLDFECEACRRYYPATKQLKQEYGDKIQFAIRYFPLPSHKNSRTAAYAAEAAGKQGKFWAMADILFAKNAEWAGKQVADQALFEKYATEIGLNMEQYRKDVVSEEVMKRVDDSYNEGVALGIRGTPTFFLDGDRMTNPQDYAGFKKLIDDALAK